MDEAGRDRSPGNVEDGENDARGAARLEREWGAGLELEQLVELEPAGADASARVDEFGDGGHPRLQPPRRERPVRLSDEQVRARVLLPEDLEVWVRSLCSPLRTRTHKHRRDGRRRRGEFRLRAGNEGGDVLDLLLGQVVLERRHRSAAVGDLRHDVVVRRRRVVEVRADAARRAGRRERVAAATACGREDLLARRCGVRRLWPSRRPPLRGTGYPTTRRRTTWRFTEGGGASVVQGRADRAADPGRRRLVSPKFIGDAPCTPMLVGSCPKRRALRSNPRSTHSGRRTRARTCSSESRTDSLAVQAGMPAVADLVHAGPEPRRRPRLELQELLDHSRTRRPRGACPLRRPRRRPAIGSGRPGPSRPRARAVALARRAPGRRAPGDRPRGAGQADGASRAIRVRSSTISTPARSTSSHAEPCARRVGLVHLRAMRGAISRRSRPRRDREPAPTVATSALGVSACRTAGPQRLDELGALSAADRAVVVLELARGRRRPEHSPSGGAARERGRRGLRLPAQQRQPRARTMHHSRGRSRRLRPAPRDARSSATRCRSASARLRRVAGVRVNLVGLALRGLEAGGARSHRSTGGSRSATSSSRGRAGCGRKGHSPAVARAPRERTSAPKSSKAAGAGRRRRARVRASSRLRTTQASSSARSAR